MGRSFRPKLPRGKGMPSRRGGPIAARRPRSGQRRHPRSKTGRGHAQRGPTRRTTPTALGAGLTRHDTPKTVQSASRGAHHGLKRQDGEGTASAAPQAARIGTPPARITPTPPWCSTHARAQTATERTTRYAGRGYRPTTDARQRTESKRSRNARARGSQLLRELDVETITFRLSSS